jgi:hypothetical protein
MRPSCFRKEKLLKTLMVFTLLLVASPAGAQAWREIPCTESAIRYSPDVRCTAQGSSLVLGSGIRAASVYYAIDGTVAGTRVNFTLLWPASETYVKAYTNAQAAAGIKSREDVRAKASEWGELRNIGDISYMTFKMGKQDCVGIDQAGPMYGYGYAWQMVGYACRGEITGEAGAFVKSVLENIKIEKRN